MIFEEVQAFCETLPGTTTDLKWGCDLCFCVGEKMYLVCGVGEDGPPSLSFKTTPDLFEMLITRQGIDPAPYVARYHWVRLETPDCMEDEELTTFIRASYDMVFAKLPAKIRKQIIPKA